MRYWVGITDRSWYEKLRQQAPDEVNFWQPSPRPLALFLQPGVPFLFKLHAPNHFIVGGGYFVRFSALPARLAWDSFEQKNGVDTYAELRARVVRYRGPFQGDPQIGCNVLTAPFFFPRDKWIPAPANWPPNVVRGLTMDTANAAGQALWDAVEQRIGSQIGQSVSDPAGPRFGAAYLQRARLGQGAFRVLVTEAYDRRCAISGERTLPVLEAAHIRPYATDGTHSVSNGLLLRADLHTLFDDGYLTVTEDYRVRVSPRIREQFQNGREYYRYDGHSLVSLPKDPGDHPARDLLRWHSTGPFLA